MTSATETAVAPITVDRSVLAAVTFADKSAWASKYRAALACVSFKGRRAYAADGFRAIAIDLPAVTRTAEQPANVNAADLADAFKRFARKDQADGLQVTPVAGLESAQIANGDGSVETFARVTELTFPDVESLFPQGEPAAAVSFNGKWMADALAAIAKAGVESDQVTLQLYQDAGDKAGYSKRIVLRATIDTGDGREIRALVMPMVK